MKKVFCSIISCSKYSKFHKLGKNEKLQEILIFKIVQQVGKDVISKKSNKFKKYIYFWSDPF